MTITGHEDAAHHPGAASSFVYSPDLEPLSLEYFRRPVEQVARDLLGAVVESALGGELVAALVVETEAYGGIHDEASHGHERFGVTRRNEVMYGPPARAYVYRIYGVHWCLNAVTGEEGFPAAVLIRAARPLFGTSVMRERRPGRSDHDLLRGPANLARALAVDGASNSHPLDRSPLRFLCRPHLAERWLSRGPRIGISRAVDLPLRFWIADDPHVSRSFSRPRQGLS
jgi:DNA-3-methyladenine glycosylase